ncbi:MAG: hypothetical protein OXD42_00345, partial [Rhodospirillaceae bacterium]|nr:hypothetical protein [Rhodospirillaceae bacterium]
MKGVAICAAMLSRFGHYHRIRFGEIDLLGSFRLFPHVVELLWCRVYASQRLPVSLQADVPFSSQDPHEPFFKVFMSDAKAEISC